MNNYRFGVDDRVARRDAFKEVLKDEKREYSRYQPSTLRPGGHEVEPEFLSIQAFVAYMRDEANDSGVIPPFTAEQTQKLSANLHMSVEFILLQLKSAGLRAAERDAGKPPRGYRSTENVWAQNPSHATSGQEAIIGFASGGHSGRKPELGMSRRKTTVRVGERYLIGYQPTAIAVEVTRLTQDGCLAMVLTGHDRGRVQQYSQDFINSWSYLKDQDGFGVESSKPTRLSSAKPERLGQVNPLKDLERLRLIREADANRVEIEKAIRDKQLAQEAALKEARRREQFLYRMLNEAEVIRHPSVAVQDRVSKAIRFLNIVKMYKQSHGDFALSAIAEDIAAVKKVFVELVG